MDAEAARRSGFVAKLALDAATRRRSSTRRSAMKIGAERESIMRFARAGAWLRWTARADPLQTFEVTQGPGESVRKLP